MNDNERCNFCGEERSPDEFEDGLRCVHCAEEQDAPKPPNPGAERFSDAYDPPAGRRIGGQWYDLDDIPRPEDL